MLLSWNNPHDCLPITGELVWILIKDKYYRPDHKNHRIYHGQTHEDKLTGERYIQEGIYGGKYYFYNVDLNKRINYIAAWASYIIKDIPSYDPLTLNESEELITNDEYMKRYFSYREAWADKRLKFISAEKCMPNLHSLYVVISDSGRSLCIYKGESKNCWYTQDGEIIKYWFPIPNNI